LPLSHAFCSVGEACQRFGINFLGCYSVVPLVGVRRLLRSADWDWRIYAVW
jgi:hypothetical protein